MVTPDAETEKLIKAFVVTTAAGWIAAARTLALETNPEDPSLVKKFTIDILTTGGITHYFNECYHGYFQKTDPYVVGKIDAFKKKTPICILNVLFITSYMWMLILIGEPISELCTAEFLSMSKTDANAKTDAWLERNYETIAETVRKGAHPCSECQPHEYIPGKDVFTTTKN